MTGGRVISGEQAFRKPKLVYLFSSRRDVYRRAPSTQVGTYDLKDELIELIEWLDD